MAPLVYRLAPAQHPPDIREQRRAATIRIPGVRAATVCRAARRESTVDEARSWCNSQAARPKPVREPP
jgi:hypothetical protein